MPLDPFFNQMSDSDRLEFIGVQLLKQRAERAGYQIDLVEAASVADLVEAMEEVGKGRAIDGGPGRPPTLRAAIEQSAAERDKTPEQRAEER